MTPALPPPQGPAPAKAKFFAEAAAAFELLALFYSLTEAEQIEFREFVAGLAAEVGNRQKGKT
jgi:hypothetical protein